MKAGDIMRIAGELSSLQSGQVQNAVQVNALKKSLDATEQVNKDLLQGLAEVAQGIQEASPVGKNVDFYA